MTSVQINDNRGQHVASASLLQVSGSPGLGSYWLNVLFEIRPTVSTADGTVLFGLVADLVVGGKTLPRLHPQPTILPRALSSSWSEFQVPLSCDLSRSQLEAVEEIRNGSNLQLNLTLYAQVALAGGDTWHSTGQIQHTIGQSDWIALLGTLGYRRTLLLEVPLPDAVADPELAAAASSLGEAYHQLQIGHYRPAVAGCRDALEQLTTALGDLAALPQPVKKSLTGQVTKTWTKAERLRLLRQAVYILSSPAHHGDSAAALFEWDREDAVAIIGMTAAVIRELSAPQARPEPSGAARAEPTAEEGSVQTAGAAQSE